MEFSSAVTFMRFLLLLCVVVLTGGYYWLYAAHSFVVVVDETAAGIDEVKWPDLPIIDCLGRLFYLLWLATIAVLPAWLIALWAAPELISGPLGVIPAFLAGVWLLFPILLLSSLTGRSKLVVLHYQLLRRLLRRPLSLLLFYALSGAVLFGAGLFGIYALRHPLLLLLAAPAGVAALLVHARLVGRLAWLLGHRTPIKTPKKKTETPARALTVADPWTAPEQAETALSLPAPAADPPADAAPGAEPPAIEEIDDEDEFAPRKNPYALAPGAARRSPPATALPQATGDGAEEDEWTPRKKPYALRSERAAPAPTAPVRVEPAPDPYGIRAAVPTPERPEPAEALPPGAAPLPEMPKADAELPLWLYLREQPNPPRYAFFSGVFTFPGYSSVLRPCVQLCLLALIWSFCLSMLVSIWPM